MLQANITRCKLLFRRNFLKISQGISMKSLFAVLLALAALNVSAVFADEALPEIAPEEEAAPPALDAPATE